MANSQSSVVEAEKGNNLSPHNLHIRLRVLEIVVLISLVLNLALWFFAGNLNSKVENRIDRPGQASNMER